MNILLSGPRPIRLDTFGWPRSWRVLVLAPHPDDFDAMGVTLRHLWTRGLTLGLLVLSSSANGVEDSFGAPPTATGVPGFARGSTSAAKARPLTPEAKAALREDEQRASCRFFGFPEDRIEFLRLSVAWPGGYLVDGEENFGRLEHHVRSFGSDVVCLPHGNDTNPDHRLAFLWAKRLASVLPRPVTALLVRDPKTIDMRDDAYVPFDEKTAEWKAELLRCHRSQHQRNLNTRGYGFDDRILGVNRDNARRLGLEDPYAEAFEIEVLT
jgi:LmbE family N-acetylglucosaminyl deacetylase